MATTSQRQKGRNNVLSTLDVTIEVLNIAKEISSITPAKAVFGSVGVLLTMIKDTMINEQDYVEIGLNCADICTALDRGTNGKKLDDLGQSVCEAINQLTTTVEEIQRKVIKQSERNVVSRLFHSKGDKDTIAAWRLDLDRILHVFNTELAINTHAAVSGIRHDVANTHSVVSDVHHNLASTHSVVSDTRDIVSDTRNIVSDIHRTFVNQQGSVVPSRPPQTSAHGESPPPPPRACFGRDELIEKVVGLAENLEPVALIGAGGIGKTSIALTVLHHARIKTRFGDNRRFVRCDQFPASLPHFLSRLSKAIGAGIENPEDLTPLRPFLSSNEMILILDNAESILDPQGPDAREVYTVVEELSRFSNICLGITSRISTVPPHCKRPTISTLSMESACDIFYAIYENGGRSDIISNLVKQLDFHALSITLLATTASHNMWKYDRLAKRWDLHRAQVLRTDYNESLAATIELSLASPTFRKLGPDARDLLGVVAFFPQGANEDNLGWLFPTISDREDIFDKFCLLSLTYRSNGFITMLAPIRDYLSPSDPSSSPLLCATKHLYFTRLSVTVDPMQLGFEEARWIVSEDVNVEHLLNVFTSIDAESGVVWDVCTNFLEHLYWYKCRYTVLGPKIERLPDDHRSKPNCLTELSRLSQSVGNFVEQKRLLTHGLKLEREREHEFEVARILRLLSGVNRELGLYKEGMQQAEEAVGIYERLGDVVGQSDCWADLSRLLLSDKQLDAAEEAGFRSISLLPEKGQEFPLCQRHRTLGRIYRSKEERDKAVHHFEIALGIASRFNWHSELCWVNHSLAQMSIREKRFDDAHVHIEQAKTHTVDDEYGLGRLVELQARAWLRQGKLEDAMSEAFGALKIYEKLGASKDAGRLKKSLRKIERSMAAGGGSSSTSANAFLDD